MPNKFVLASAGAGKTTTLIENALRAVGEGQSVLILTYTRNNQAEIVRRILDVNGHVPGKIKVKGWFSFLLEDLIRPYQRHLFPERISNIVFDQSDPHIRNGRHIPGRSEKLDGQINPRYFLFNDAAHTTYISKLAARICDATKVGIGRAARYSAIERLSEVYDLLVIDEVQDLVGWDYSVLEYILSNQNLSLFCVGDFRQTIYQTSHANKNPQTSDQKRQWFVAKGFECENLNHSWRCVNEVCAFADLVHSHQDYAATVSRVRVVPEEFEQHVGIFVVSNRHVATYIEQFNPTILRRNRATRNDLCKSGSVQNFGEAKGLGYDRVLVIPTQGYLDYLLGDMAALRRARTEEGLNKLYVAITRARYSVAFLSDDVPLLEGVSIWTP